MSVNFPARLLLLLTLLAPLGCAHWGAGVPPSQSEMTGRGLSITLGRSMLPDGRSMFNANAFATLDHIAAYLESRPYLKVLVEGHADAVSTGKEAFHYRLSEARAEQVRDALVRRGVDAERIHVEGLGDYMLTELAARGSAEPIRVEVVMSELRPVPQTIPAEWVMDRVRERYPVPAGE